MIKKMDLNFRMPNMKTIVAWAIPATLLGYSYYPTAVWMVDRWTAADSYFAHGFIIPIVSLYWLISKRKAIAESKFEKSYVGLALLLFGAVTQIAACYLRFYFLSAFSFVLVVLGLVYFLFGLDLFRKVWFPIAFMFLMIPLPLLAISQITLKLKFFVTEVATFMINEIGITAVQQGSYIRTPNSILLVGDPCSGLRSFLSFLCLGFVFAYDQKLCLWKKVVLIFSGFPLAVCSNILRVLFLGLVGEIYGMQYTGPGTLPHDGSGIAVFVLAFALFMFIRSRLEAIHVK